MVTKTQKLIPLIDIQDEEFAEQYKLGLKWAMYGEREDDGPLPDSYLVQNLRSYEERGYFERH